MEETGLDVEPDGIVGIYSNPQHVVEYADGEVRQQFSVCFACRVVEAMPMHESIRLRIRHYLEHRPQPVIA